MANTELAKEALLPKEPNPGIKKFLQIFLGGVGGTIPSLKGS